MWGSSTKSQNNVSLDSRIQNGKDSAECGKSSGRSATAFTRDSTQRVSDLILENRLITCDELENATGL
jgi:hypothetical protein